jgi:hypothetical protein
MACFKKSTGLFLILSCFNITLFSQTFSVNGPDGKLQVNVYLSEGKPEYDVKYQGVVMLENSPLGMITNVGDFSKKMKVTGSKTDKIDKIYRQEKIKKSMVHYQANELVISLENEQKHPLDIVFRVSNNDIAFSYRLHRTKNIVSCMIEKEMSGYNFSSKTTTFLTPQATPMIGWERTKPSYEEDYVLDEAMGIPSKYGVGYTFPGLFRIGNDGWVLLSETGVSGAYCGSKLSEGNAEGLYTIAFPEAGENNGVGNAAPALALPGSTPWRTLTVGNTLKPIVETTIPFDVVEPLYEPSEKFQYGRGTWSWIMWQDNSMNWDDQITFINLAAEMGYEYILVDALWDTQVGYERMPALFRYAQSKGVDIFLWYNSNGYWNNAPQGPKQRMNNSIDRRKEMKWLQSLGVKGLKVDFFGGDKQVTMQLYQDILADANEYGLMVDFHGCTLPRGWERMYPNYVGSEAVLASENLIFQQKYNDLEATNASLHPFIRNAVGAMEFGPVLLNKRHNRTNNGGHYRRTSEIFQLATAVLFQNPVQFFGITPNNLTEMPAFIIDFMKDVPTTWNETVFIDGYPGKYILLARRCNNKWYLAGVNAQKETVNLKINLSMLAGKHVNIYRDDAKLNPVSEIVKISASGECKITIPSNGGIILKELR